MAVPKLRFKGFISDWDSRKFSDALSFLGTNSFSRDNMNLVSGSVKNIHYGDILVIYGNVLDTSCEQIPFVNEDVNISKIKEKDYLLSGDVIIADTAEDYTVGKATEIINSKGIKIIAGLHTQACRPKMKFAVGYLGNFVNSLAFRKQIRRIAQGTKVLSIIKKYIEDTEIHFPIEKEQQKIADFLTTFDKRITAQQNIVADLEETKKGLLQKIFSQEIRFKDDNGQDYPDWEEKRIKDLGEIVTGNTPSTKVKSYYENGTILWVTPTDISDEMYIFDTERKLTSLGINKAHFLPKGSVLITCIASIGKMTILGEDGSCNQQINAIIPNSDNDSIFILSLLRTLVPVMFIFAGKTATPIINKKTFSRIKCFVPCLAEQQKIADFLSTFDKKITAEKQVLSDLQEMKKGLLQQMFV